MNDAPSNSAAADAPEEPLGREGDRIMSSVALFTSKSVKELEGLTFELHELQEFLKSETARVQRDIDNALAGLKVIMETISPWRNARPEDSVQEKTPRPETPRQRFNGMNGQR